MFKELGVVQKFLVASVFPIVAVIVPAVTSADFTSTSGIITFVSGLLVAFGVYVVPNKKPAA